MKLDVINLDGGKGGSIELPDDIFGIEDIRGDILQRCVTWQLAKRRAGTHKVQVRNEVSRTSKKMYKQKGTGNARMGAKRTPVRRGGGHANARQPRSYYYRLPRKAVQAATRMAIAAKITSGAVVVVDQFKMDAPKTKTLASAFKAIGLEGVTKTFVTNGLDKNLYLSGRNIEGLTVSPVGDLNALIVLRPRKVVLTKDAMDWLKAKVSA